MAATKRSPKTKLVDTVSPEEIVYKSEEEGYTPFFLIEDTIGIATDELQYILVELKDCARTIKNAETGEEYVEAYKNWTPMKKYARYMENIIACYTDTIEKRKAKELVKSKDYKDLVKIRQEINDTIRAAFNPEGLNSEFVASYEAVDAKVNLNRKIAELKALKESVEKEFAETMEYIKSKRRIIVAETEPKKHRTKKED